MPIGHVCICHCLTWENTSTIWNAPGQSCPDFGGNFVHCKTKIYIGNKIVQIFFVFFMKLYLIDMKYKISARLSQHEVIDKNTPNLGQSLRFSKTLRYAQFCIYAFVCALFA